MNTSGNKGLIVAGLLLAAGLVWGGWQVGQGLERFRTGERTVTVKGLAEMNAPADYASWSLTFRRAGDVFNEVQQTLSTDRDKVLVFLRGLGFSADEIEVRPLQVQDVFAREYVSPDQPFRYTGQGQVIVKSSRVDAVANAALAIDPLIQQGLVVEVGSGPQYQLRAFNEAKAPLLAEATRNAQEQATRFAGDAGASLGRLQKANQGVIQIFGESADFDDSSSRIKRLRVVSTFEYQLD
ncbi:MAG: SIMPL domain-containing protein [Alcaligenaceae bacterium]|nr:SIMPL domain-containing protein [Alcaligenaceae bacterium]